MLVKYLGEDIFPYFLSCKNATKNLPLLRRKSRKS